MYAMNWQSLNFVEYENGLRHIVKLAKVGCAITGYGFKELDHRRQHYGRIPTLRAEFVSLYVILFVTLKNEVRMVFQNP